MLINSKIKTKKLCLKKTITIKFFSGASIGIFLAFATLTTGCDNSSSKSEIEKKLSPHDALYIIGEVAVLSDLAVISENSTESAVSVTNGGTLTLSNSKIVKTAPVGSMAGVKHNDTAPPNNQIDLAAPADPQQKPTSAYTTGPPNPNNAPGSNQAPDPSLAPDTPGPPGTPGGAPPAGEEPGGNDKARGGGSSIGSKGSGVYTSDKGTATLSNVTINTDADEGKGLCVIGQGSSITLNTGRITTAGASSHGIFTAAGGMATLKNVSISTTGEHSSIIATDTGGGKIVVEGGEFTAAGKYSSGIYSTGDIRVSNATIKSENDNVAVMEFDSKISLNNTSLWSGCKGAVMIYQSFSSSDGMSSFKMTGGGITAEEGPLFYITNTNAAIEIKDVKLSSASGTLIKVSKGDWGSDVESAKPTRGGTVSLIATKQSLTGDISIDENSSISMKLKNNAKLNGAINGDDKGGMVALDLDGSSNWDVTDDSYLSCLSFSEGIHGNSISNITGNGHTIYYDKTLSPSLGGKTYILTNGGTLRPK